jgi:hypothetical protein
MFAGLLVSGAELRLPAHGEGAEEQLQAKMPAQEEAR